MRRGLEGGSGCGGTGPEEGLNLSLQEVGVRG